VRHLADWKAGALVALLALPLSLGIALASGFPASAGIVTAVVGGLVASWLGSARLTIKGPAAGLIVLVLAAVHDLGVRGALATFVVVGVAQVAMGRLGATRLIRFVPPAVIHGMLAAIGIIVFVKQLPVLLAVPSAGGDVLESLTATLAALHRADPGAVAVGLSTLAVLGGLAFWAARRPALRSLPAPLLAVAGAAGLALALGLPAETAAGVPVYLSLPASPAEWILSPDFGALAAPIAWYHVALLTAVGSLESLLTVRALDGLSGDESDLGRDLVAVGLGNVVAGAIGGLPMISEVVRSTANLSYGARSRLANASHGATLLVAVVLFPGVLAHVPLPALAALLVAVAAKLASPASFRQQLRLGADRTLTFSATLIGALAVDLLVGILVGVGVELALRAFHGVSPSSLRRADLRWAEGDRLEVHGSLLFCHVGALQREVERRGERPIAVDLSRTTLVDHGAMALLATLEAEGAVRVEGLDLHRSLASHPQATRVRRSA
jgi:MFS superfamily sulfate permease-like transporter